MALSSLPPDSPPLAPQPVFRVALVGNPNTGKTTLFNALSGLRQRVGNYPGVTVETKKGQITCGGRPAELIDLPGTYSLAPRSPDEMVAVDLILGPEARVIDDGFNEPRPDVVVSIVDASNLERNLYLTTQLFELGVPVVIALNMVDVAQAQGLTLHPEQLAKRLGVPVVPIQANKRRGLDELRAAITAAAGNLTVQQAPFPLPFEREVDQLHAALGRKVPVFLVRRLLLDMGGYIEQRLAAQHGEELQQKVAQARLRLAEAGCSVAALEARTRYGWIREQIQGCVERPAQRVITWTDRIDSLLTHRILGTLIFLVLMFLVFQAIFTGARPLMKGIGFGKDLLVDFLRGILPPGPFSSLLLDGVLEGVGAVVVFLPQIMILFGFVAILEDCGYMARAAFLMDRLMARCGLSGKSFIPMLSSVACAVPGIMATRVIENRRDRLATILVAPLMSCSARLPIYILLIAAFLTEGFPVWLPGMVMFAMYSIGLVIAPLVALALKSTLLRGETPVFVMEMPLYKLPSMRTVLGRMVDSGWAFLRRAGTIILASMVLVWALLYFPHSESPTQIQSFLEEQKAEAAGLRDQLAGAPASERPALEGRLERKLEAEKEVQTQGLTYDRHEALLQQDLEELRSSNANEEQIQAREDEINEVVGRWKRQSFLGRMGRILEPAARPLGWDWKIAMAVLASFPAREVIVGTLGIIYNQGKVESDDVESSGLVKTLREAYAEEDPGRKVFSIPTALSLMVFFALCCQCTSTLAVIRRETRSWRWPLFTFTYMTALAYLAALLVYQVGRLCC